MSKTFTITIPRTYTYQGGWGVFVNCVYDYEDENGNELSPDTARITDIDVEVVQISEGRVAVVGGAACVFGPSEVGVPVDSFLDVPDLTEDDTHDLRSRYFPTRDAAEEWAGHVRQLWKHPNPWTAFVRFV
jgi:hypothetical protein